MRRIHASNVEMFGVRVIPCGIDSGMKAVTLRHTYTPRVTRCTAVGRTVTTPLTVCHFTGVVTDVGGEFTPVPQPSEELVLGVS